MGSLQRMWSTLLLTLQSLKFAKTSSYANIFQMKSKIGIPEKIDKYLQTMFPCAMVVVAAFKKY